MILVILPYNNPLDERQPKPVVLAMLPYIVYSQFSKDICIFSAYTDKPNNGFNNKIFSQEDSLIKSYTRAVLLEIQKMIYQGIKIPVVEVHQDIKLASAIAKKFPKIKVSVVKHGDYCVNRFREKFSLVRSYYYHRYLKYLHNIYCNSEYVTEQIQNNYPKISDRVITIYNTYGHISEEIKEFQETKPKKRNQIIFAGKPVHYKGINELMLALPSVLKKHSNYNAVIVAAFFSKKRKYSRTMEKLVSNLEIKKFIDENRIIIFKNLFPGDVFKNMTQSKIAVVPTTRREPFGLVCLEAHMAKCAVLSSGLGGLREVSGDYALELSEVTVEDMISKLNYLIENENILEKFALEGNEHCAKQFDPKRLSRLLDDKRIEIMNEYKD